MKIFLLILLISAGSICYGEDGSRPVTQIFPFYSAQNDRYGYKNEKGEVVVTPIYDLAYLPEEGLAAVKLNGKYGYVNIEGKEVISLKYDFTWKFIGGYAAVKLNEKYGFIDQKGKEVIPIIYDEGYNYHGTCCYKGMAHVRQNGKWKVIKIAPDK